MRYILNSSLWQRPVTRLGWWAVSLAGVFIMMFVINAVVFVPAAQDASNTGWRQALLPFYGIFMMLLGLSAGVVSLIALIRKHERSWLVWLTVLPGVFILIFILGEFLVPH